MKKSYIYFSIATLIMLSAVVFPGISGDIHVDKAGNPTDFLSKIWTLGHKVELRKTYPENVRILKINGNGHNISLRLYNSDDPQNYQIKKSNQVDTKTIGETTGDTLVFNFKDNAELTLSAAQLGISKIILNNTKGFVTGELQRTELDLIVDQGSKIMLFLPTKDPISLLHLALNNKSIVNFLEGKVPVIHSTIQDGELNYSNNLASDSLIVNLKGRSIVKSESPDIIHELHTLIVKGDKQHFKEALVGRNVKLSYQ